MTGIVPQWLESWLGVESAGAGEGTIATLRHSWPLPAWATVSLVLLGIAAFVMLYLREAAAVGRPGRLLLASLRAAAWLIVLFMLAQFLLTLERTGLPHVAVVVDNSASMSIVDRFTDPKVKGEWEARLKPLGLNDASRLNLARVILLENDAELLRHLDKHYKWRLYLLSGSARAQSGAIDEAAEQLRQALPEGDATRLGDGVREVLDDLRGSPPAALVLLTDGINTAGPDLAEASSLASRRHVPMFTVGVGSQTPLRDLDVQDLLVDEVAFVNDVIQFEFKLIPTGYAGRKINLKLRRRDRAEPLATAEVTAGEDGKPQRVRIPYRPTEVGDFEFIVEAEKLDDEFQADNNSRQRLVSVRKEQIRVLLVQAYPSYEFRYLKQLLDRDNTVDLKTVLQESDSDYVATDETALGVFPVRREELFAYDVVIFGDVNPSLASTSLLANLAAFVSEKGGGLVVIAGPRYTPALYFDSPLAPLLPIDSEDALAPDANNSIVSGFSVQPTELGFGIPPLQLGDSIEDNPAVWAKLPQLHWLFEAPNMKPAARVLAESSAIDGRRWPVIAMQYYGAGKVVFHATDETWRWRFQVGDALFARYWVQTLRWLSRSKLLGKDRTAELTVDRREYRRGEPIRLRVRFVDDREAPADDNGVVVVVEQEGRQNHRVTLTRNSANRGVFEGLLPGAAEGKYHAWIAVPGLDRNVASADFQVVAPPGEFERTQLDAAALRQASEDTGGKYYSLTESRRLVRDLPDGQQVPIEALPPLPLWNRWPLLFVFLSLLVGEWSLRKRWGML